MTIELGGYEMRDSMLDVGYNVNTLPNKSWDFMGKPKLV